MDHSVENLLSGRSGCKFAGSKALKFKSFLVLLAEAKEYATDLNLSPWDFAVNPGDYEELKINLNDLRWMTCKGWIKLREDPVTGNSTFIITQVGLFSLGQVLGDEFQSEIVEQVKLDQPKLKPCWDPQRHELKVANQIVKRFRWPASNQEMILSVFEEDCWPARIDDPLPLVDGIDPKRRLSDTIKCLNRNQQVNLLRFRGDGTGEGVLWDVVSFES